MTDSEFIDELGGTTAAARLFGVQPTVISNWRKRSIPARYHVMASKIASERGLAWSPPMPGRRVSEAA
jgi:DNA-binding transcriptional regulator YdaS (Cro superfamily)